MEAHAALIRSRMLKLAATRVRERESVHAFAVAAKGPDGKSKVAGHLAAKESTHAVRLPCGRGHKLMQRCTVRLAQHANDEPRPVLTSAGGLLPGARGLTRKLLPDVLNGAPESVDGDSPVFEPSDWPSARQLVPYQGESRKRPVGCASPKLVGSAEHQRCSLRLGPVRRHPTDMI